jgi:hypothetical protein
MRLWRRSGPKVFLADSRFSTSLLPEVATDNLVLQEYGCSKELNAKLTPGQRVSEALAAGAAIHRPPARPEFLNSLDAMDLHIARYQQNGLLTFRTWFRCGTRDALRPARD